MSPDTAYLLGLGTPFAVALPFLLVALRRAKRGNQ